MPGVCEQSLRAPGRTGALGLLLCIDTQPNRTMQVPPLGVSGAVRSSRRQGTYMSNSSMDRHGVLMIIPLPSPPFLGIRLLRRLLARKHCVNALSRTPDDEATRHEDSGREDTARAVMAYVRICDVVAAMSCFPCVSTPVAIEWGGP